MSSVQPPSADDSTLLPAAATPPEEVPLCLHCLEPVHPLDYYCPHCGEAVGCFTPYIPFVNIPFEISFFARLWRKLWRPVHTPIGTRALWAVLIVLLAPAMLLGLPFALHRRSRPRTLTPPDPPPPPAGSPHTQG
jgi:hypothetical protein